MKVEKLISIILISKKKSKESCLNARVGFFDRMCELTLKTCSQAVKIIVSVFNIMQNTPWIVLIEEK